MTRKEATRDPGSLDRVVAEWKRRNPGEDDGLSASTRAAIRDSITGRSPARAPLAALFVPSNRLILAGILPALLLAAAFGLVLRPGQIPLPVEVGHAPMTAKKVGNDVIFEIANGHRAHSVYKSTDPRGFSTSPTFVTEDGSFRDELANGPSLVFYRID